MDASLYKEKIDEIAKALSEESDLDFKIDMMNKIRWAIHEVSPLKSEPVDYVMWTKVDNVIANTWNPNSVAPPEMALLQLSIYHDGFTQPVVVYKNKENGIIEVVDGFHRSKVCKEYENINNRVHGYLPITLIKEDCIGLNDRVASTIRHNRARGKHSVEGMSEIVLELKNRNWKNERIARELGMDEEEILRLCQITGLEGLFKDDDFSRAWESSDTVEWFEDLDDSEEIETKYRTVNTEDPTRIFHTFDKWECYKAGFYATSVEGKTADECERAYAEFLKNSELFKSACCRVISEWKYSCEHYLTNTAMNRIAWMGQASACIAEGLPNKYCSGFNLLSEEEQLIANNIALDAINQWMKNNNRKTLSIDEAQSTGRQVNIY